MKFGVIRFPGSLRRRRRAAGRAAGRRGGRCCGTPTATSRASTRSSSPAASPTATTCAPGAIARFAPVMEEVAEFARAGGLVLGICNGFQVLCEAGLLPGRAAAQHLAAVRLPPGRARGRRAPTRRSRARCDAGPAPVDPGQAHDRPLLRARRRARAPRGRRPGAAALRARARTPTARCDDIAGVCNERGNVFGLMPHPEHAVDPLTGSTDGLAIFESIRAHVADRVARERPPSRCHRTPATASSGSPTPSTS